MTPADLTHISTAYERAAIDNPPAWHPYPSTLANGYRLALRERETYLVRDYLDEEKRAECERDVNTGELGFVVGDGRWVQVEAVFCGVEEV